MLKTAKFCKNKIIICTLSTYLILSLVFRTFRGDLSRMNDGESLALGALAGIVVNDSRKDDEPSEKKQETV